MCLCVCAPVSLSSEKVQGLCYVPHTRQLISCSSDGGIIVWNMDVTRQEVCFSLPLFIVIYILYGYTSLPLVILVNLRDDLAFECERVSNKCYFCFCACRTVKRVQRRWGVSRPA